MSVRRVVVVAVAAASLALGGTVTNASTAGPADQPKRHGLVKDGPPAQAVGLIVKTSAGQPSAKLRASAQSAIGRRATVTAARPVASRIASVRFDRVLNRADALAAAKAMEQEPGIEAATPDMLRHVFSTKPPVSTNDTYFTSLQHLWDRRASSPSLPQNFAPGGFSTRAPNVWRASTGSSKVVVAVLDTGITNHKDFNQRRLTGGGYDFVSAGPWFVANYQTRDGDEWDPNPADPGDWQVQGDCGYDHPAYDSSWHGSHVAGIIAAQANNKMGVAGVAPDVRFAPVRVVGHCGAVDSDILAAITWSTGGHVDGVPNNPQANWAKVVNLSLGYDDYEEGYLKGDTSYVDSVCAMYAPVVADARERGAVVVAAAGNSAMPIRYSIPGACSGVFTVGATSARGYAAEYSNYSTFSDGGILDISAPGGDVYYEGPSDAILSTVNTGAEDPVGPTYRRMAGTSMSAPMVSGAAALLYSLGMTTAAQVEKGLIGAIQPFAVLDSDWGQLNCAPGSTFYCGVGILNLARVQAILKGKRPTITGTPKVGQTLKTSTYGQWNNSNAGFDFQWYRDSDEIAGATSTSYKLTSADLGRRVKVKVTPHLVEFRPLFHTSPATAAVAKATSTVSASVPAKASSQSFVTVSATVTAPGIPASALVGVLDVYDENTIIATKNLTAGDLGKASITLPVKLTKGTHRIRIRFGGTDIVAASISASRYITVS